MASYGESRIVFLLLLVTLMTYVASDVPAGGWGGSSGSGWSSSPAGSFGGSSGSGWGSNLGNDPLLIVIFVTVVIYHVVIDNKRLFFGTSTSATRLSSTVARVNSAKHNRRHEAQVSTVRYMLLARLGYLGNFHSKLLRLPVGGQLEEKK
ncbi:unnamed protein product [Toxocara canis]|uniref:Uncharacterized protein n=1 Tax=Toxocara canis TaxID=6265 RepID=A0A183UTG8_TOXCA|nr:unnamed protein product [Toxocara canis]